MQPNSKKYFWSLTAIIAITGSIFLLSCQPKLETVPQHSSNEKKVIIAYVPGFRGLIDPNLIDPLKITHINYAFVNIKDSMAWLTNIETDTVNFKMLNGLKTQNPELKILIAVGGWSWSDQFSDAVLTESSRIKFAESCVDIVEKWELDGVDIDWEYPGQRGEDNIFRSEDKVHYTLMFEEIRKALDQLSQKTGKSYEITTAVGANQAYIDHTEMDKVAKIIDYVNLMTYDFYTVGPQAGHHANLYQSQFGESSAHQSVIRFKNAGVTADKLVLGVPFYARRWTMQSTKNNGIDQPIEKQEQGYGYSILRDSIQHNPTFQYYWDEKAQAPYLFSETTKQLISFDDEKSIKLKCEYLLKEKLGGIMFWQYASDPKEYLLDEINKQLTKP